MFQWEQGLVEVGVLLVVVAGSNEDQRKVNGYLIAMVCDEGESASGLKRIQWDWQQLVLGGALLLG